MCDHKESVDINELSMIILMSTTKSYILKVDFVKQNDIISCDVKRFDLYNV